jgi:hypothetical protein
MLALKSITAFLIFLALLSLNLNNFAQPFRKSNALNIRVKDPHAVDPIGGILKLFETRPLVALDEGGHHTAQTHAFFRTLVQDPRFFERVNDIVVEFGTCKYQDVIDRYLNGENVPLEKLQLVWRETTQVYVFDNPVYRQFFETVRNVNLKLPKNKRIRVLLGDPAIDWGKVNNFDDWVKQANRDTNAAQIIEREVLQKRRKAVLIYGGTHIVRRDVYRNFEPTPGDFAGVVEQIERFNPKSTYSVWANTVNDDLGVSESNLALFPIPSLVMLKGTTLGARDFTSVLAKETREANRIKFENGKRISIAKDEFAKLSLEENVDALLYLGPVKYLYKTPYFIDTYSDENYYLETIRRSRILNEINLEDIEELRRKYLKGKKNKIF